MNAIQALEATRQNADLFARPKLRDSYAWKHPLFFANYRWSRHLKPDSSSPPNIPIEQLFLEWEVIEVKQLEKEAQRKSKRAGGMIAGLQNRVQELEDKLAGFTNGNPLSQHAKNAEK